jgi:hypothetical protein
MRNSMSNFIQYNQGGVLQGIFQVAQQLTGMGAKDMVQ